MVEPTEPTTTVTEAQRLRDYLLHRGGVDQKNLIVALKPFEEQSSVAPNNSFQIKQDDYSKLFLAFQEVKERCNTVVDDITLNEVLRGKSPYNCPQNAIATAGVTIAGVLLVTLAIYFTTWSQGASYLLAEAKEFENFDHFSRMNRLIELAEMVDFDEPSSVNKLSPTDSDHDLAPEELVFFEGLQEFRRHYAREAALFNDMGSHIKSVSPISASAASFRRKFCPPSVYAKEGKRPPPVLSVWHGFIGCITPIPDESKSPPPAGNQKLLGDGSIAVGPWNDLPAFKSITRYQGIQAVAMQYAERRQRDNYSKTIEQVRNWSEGLRSSIALVSQLLLPIVYGALGSIVYCMWRLLNPATSPLGFWHTLLRAAFAGLAALTLSALIVPSNVLAVGTEVTKPFIYLLSFIFGYSLEAFVNTLNALNQVLLARIGPRATPEPK